MAGLTQSHPVEPSPASSVLLRRLLPSADLWRRHSTASRLLQAARSSIELSRRQTLSSSLLCRLPNRRRVPLHSPAPEGRHSHRAPDLAQTQCCVRNHFADSGSRPDAPVRDTAAMAGSSGKAHPPLHHVHQCGRSTQHGDGVICRSSVDAWGLGVGASSTEIEEGYFFPLQALGIAMDHSCAAIETKRSDFLGDTLDFLMSNSVMAVHIKHAVLGDNTFLLQIWPAMEDKQGEAAVW